MIQIVRTDPPFGAVVGIGFKEFGDRADRHDLCRHLRGGPMPGLVRRLIGFCPVGQLRVRLRA
jgi:hypothetical protein